VHATPSGWTAPVGTSVESLKLMDMLKRDHDEHRAVSAITTKTALLLDP